MKEDATNDINLVYQKRIDAVLRHQLDLMPDQYQTVLRTYENEMRDFLYQLIPLIKSSNSQIAGFGPFPPVSARIGSALFNIKDPCQKALVDMWFYTAAGIIGESAISSAGYAIAERFNINFP